VTEMLRPLLGLKAFDSHKVTYDIHRRPEGNPKVSIHLVNRCPPRRGYSMTKRVERHTLQPCASRRVYY
jgi:hypothetical protein